jgi:hypothetical protein
VYCADSQLATHAGVSVRHGDAGLLVAGGVEGYSAVSRHVVHETEVPAAYQPEDVLDPEPAQGLGYRFVYFDLSPLSCGRPFTSEKQARTKKADPYLLYPPEGSIHSDGPGSTRPSMQRPSPSCPSSACYSGCYSAAAQMPIRCARYARKI